MAKPAPFRPLEDYYGEQAFAPELSLSPVNGLTTTHDGQLISDLLISAYDAPVQINHRVEMRNCHVLYRDAAGVLVNSGGSRSQFRDVITYCSALPNPIAALSARYGFELDNADAVVIERLRNNGGSGGLVADNCFNLQLRRLAVHNPFSSSSGAAILLRDCYSSYLRDYGILSSLTTSFAQSGLLLEDCHGINVQRGFVDGNNSVTGWAIEARDSDMCIVEDGQVAHFGGGVAATGNSKNTRFEKIHARDSHVVGQGGRSAPAIKAAFYRGDDTEATVFDRCTYFDLNVGTTALAGTAVCSIADVTQKELPDAQLQ